MNIALDVMGGDYSPEETIKGASLFLKEKDCTLTLLGEKDVVSSVMGNYSFDKNKVKVVNCPNSNSNEVFSIDVIKGKEGSPIITGMDLLKNDKADAFVSAGNSGAIMAGALLKLGCIPGVKRPAIAIIIPTLNGNKVILDVGANVDCKPIHLLHFALMGNAYAKYELGFENPKVALLNIGEEENKGNRLTREAYPLLAERGDLNFVGNIEGRDIFMGTADVIVCDGFVGNIILKTAEGLSGMFMTDFKLSILRSLPAGDITEMLKERFNDYAIRRNYKTYGGVPLLGVNGLCFICHGRSKAEAIRNALHGASIFVQNKGLEHLKKINLEN
ncbi:MAG: phosphate acyltransferase PlsX [Candidatus Atribacteria bacterium]|nr:phosphate acyltransferase PlsX [Candidatus Atribacteria bacterium]